MNELMNLDRMKADAEAVADRGEIDIEKHLQQYPFYDRCIWLTYYSFRFERNRSAAGAERAEG